MGCSRLVEGQSESSVTMRVEAEVEVEKEFCNRTEDENSDYERSFVRVETPPLKIEEGSMSEEWKHEELYRRVEHDFHWTCKFLRSMYDDAGPTCPATVRTPLWNPVLVQLGDVGYIHPETRTFTILFNAFKPFRTPHSSQISIPSIFGFGDPVIKHSKIPTQKAKRLLGLRTFTYKVDLEEGKPLAHCFCENPDWFYLEELKPVKAYFKSSVDMIVKLHGGEHGVMKEDVILGKSFLSPLLRVVSNYNLL